MPSALETRARCLFLCLSILELEALLVEVGCTIARLHDGGLVHGDLTTSNMMLRHTDNQLVGLLG